MTLKELLSSVNVVQLLACIAVILALSACNKKIKEVKIIAFDLIEAKGIPEVTLYLESGETLVTDQNGEAVLTSRRDLTDNLIGIPSFLDEYADAGLKDNCEPTTAYKIELPVLIIPFRKKTVYTVRVNSDNFSKSKGCIIFSDIECVGEVGSEIEINGDGELELPRFNQGSSFSHPIYPNSDIQEVRMYWGSECNFNDLPDSSFRFEVQYGDTNYIDLVF